MTDSLRDRILTGLGVGFLLLCFVLSLGRILWSAGPRGSAEDGKEKITIRFAHWQLEGGIREAFDEIAEEYMKRNPAVEVRQIAIPERIYPSWLITQLVGETAPDLISMGTAGMTEERRARYFQPLSEWVSLPNPHNAGTSLEGVPLRETFVDGMDSGFSTVLLEHYGVPVSTTSIRMYFNLDLLREITGDDKLPQTYEELVEICKKTLEYQKRTGRQVYPVAGSKYNSPQIMDRLFSSQTETLGERISFDFLASGPNGPLVAKAHATGEWTLDDPEIRAGLAVIRDLGQYMQPGFLQLGRDDASFYFVQGKTVMIASGSWDSTSITAQAKFDVGVGFIPVPAPGWDLAPFSKGPVADSSTSGGVIFGLNRNSRHPEAALDFLYFLASQEMNQIFTDVSKWAPSVVGVVPSEQSKMFQPFTEGSLGGLTLDFSGPDTARLYNVAFNKLVSPRGSVDEFLEAIKPGYRSALQSDLRRQRRNSLQNAQRSDTTLGALAWMHLQNPEDPAVSRKLDLLLQGSSMEELYIRRLDEALRALENTTAP